MELDPQFELWMQVTSRWGLFTPLIVNALALAATVYLVAREEAEFTWWKLAVISMGISFTSQIISGCVAAALTGAGLELSGWGLLPFLLLWGGLSLWAGAWGIQHYLGLIRRDAFVAATVNILLSFGLAAALAYT